MNKESFRMRLWLAITCIFSSFGLLLVCSRNSFLYLMNDWGDPATLFTVGRSMIHGKVLYRDIYEHKGFYYCAMHALAAAINEKSYIAIFVMEVIAFAVFLYFVYKTWRLFLDEKCIMALPIFGALVISSLSFCQGDSVEEFCMPILMYSIYELFKFLRVKEDKSVKGNIRLWIIQGVLTGIIFWMKYALCAFYIGWCIFIAIYFFKKKDVKSVIEIALLWLIGMIVASIPVIIYFVSNNALSDLWHVYGYNLIFAYKPNAKGNMNILLFVFLSLFINILFIIAGVITAMTDKLDTKEKLAIRLMFLGNVIYTLFFAWKEKYVLLCFMPIFAVWFIGLMYLIINIFPEDFKFKKLLIPIMLVSVVVSGIVCINTDKIGDKKEDYVQYEFAEIINKEKNPSLLVYRGQECGFYFATGLLPTTKYITFYNIHLPEIDDEMDRYIKDKEVEFVITIEKEPENVKRNYELVATKDYKFLSETQKYYLWKAK